MVMKNQRGAISTALVAVLIFFGLMLGVVGICLISYISGNNNAARMEKGIEAAYKDNQNILANYGQKIQEAAQVPSMQAEDFAKVYKAAIEGRYGADGSKATFQWLKEQNPNLDTKVYTKLQQLIESGRNQYQAGQTTLLDKCRVYETSQEYFWSGMWMRIAGWPKNPDLKKVCTPIVTERAAKAYETGKENGPIKLR